VERSKSEAVRVVVNSSIVAPVNSPLCSLIYRENLGEHQFADKVCYNTIMLNRLITILSLVSLGIMMVMLNFTTPAGVGPLGVLVFFTTIYIVMFGAATLLLRAYSKMNGRKGALRRKDYCYGAVMAFAPILLLLAQSFGSLSVWTVGLTAAFVFLGCFAISKRL